MRSWLAITALALGGCVGGGSVARSSPPRPRTDHPYPMVNHYGGRVLHAVHSYPIYWGAEWADPAFAGDIITGLDSFLAGWGGSHYAATNSEYYDAEGPVTSLATAMPHTIDTSSAPAPSLAVPAKYATAVAEVCKVTNDDPDPDGVYLVFTSTRNADVPSNACGWHWGLPTTSCGHGKKRKRFVLILVHYDCAQNVNTRTDQAVLGHSPPLAAMAAVTAVEYHETLTNPDGYGPVGKGWLDSAGVEATSKCVATFQPDGSYARFSNGTRWKLPGQWSNKAYAAGTGQRSALFGGQPGCVW